MKKITTFAFFFVILFANASYAQTGEKKGWPSPERYAFISECIKTAKDNMSEDSARFYCYCMQEKVEAKYPTIEEAAVITAADMQSAAWQKDIKACLNGYWNTASRNEFLSSCVKSAKEGGMENDKAHSYCECMMFKIETRYPNVEEAGKLTPDSFNTPEWQKILQGCRDF